MIIYTLWQNDAGDDEMPWLVDSVDEYTVEDGGGFPAEYQQHKLKIGVRELLISIPDEKVLSLFVAPTVRGKAVSP